MPTIKLLDGRQVFAVYCRSANRYVRVSNGKPIFCWRLRWAERQVAVLKQRHPKKTYEIHAFTVVHDKWTTEAIRACESSERLLRAGPR